MQKYFSISLSLSGFFFLQPLSCPFVTPLLRVNLIPAHYCEFKGLKKCNSASIHTHKHAAIILPRGAGYVYCLAVLVMIKEDLSKENL